MPDQPLHSPDVVVIGSLDGTGSGDHDEPFRGFRAYLFNTRQLARLLHVRSDVLEARLGYGRWVTDLIPPGREEPIARVVRVLRVTRL